MLLGAVIVVIGAALLLTVSPDSSVLYLALACFVIGLGLGFSASPGVVAAQSSVDWRSRGVVTGANMFARSVGSAVGVAIFGAVANGVVAARLGDSHDDLENLPGPRPRPRHPRRVLRRARPRLSCWSSPSPSCRTASPSNPAASTPEPQFSRTTLACMRAVDCVGVLMQDEQHRVYVQRRTTRRRLFPGIWDIVGGHVEPGETPEQTLATRTRGGDRLEACARSARRSPTGSGNTRGGSGASWTTWSTVDGDLRRPRLEDGKHDASAWVGPGDLELLMENRTDGDRRLRDIVAHVVRTRFTERLRLEPIAGPGEVLPGHAADLERLFADPWVAHWYGGAWSTEESVLRSAEMHRGWERDGVNKWMAYDRAAGSLVGRGGLSRMSADNPVTAAIAALVGPEWAVDRLELGWALTGAARGLGYATEIGRAGLEFAFETLGASAVIAFTERHNTASRAVMDRLGMPFAGEITAEGLVEGIEGVHPDAPFAVHALVR